MATYYVSKVGSSTAPYDTWEKAASLPSLAVTAGAAVVGPHTMYIAPGLYNGQLAPNTNWGDSFIIGVAAVGSLEPAGHDDVVLTKTSGSIAYPFASGLTFKNLTITGGDASSDLITSVGANFTGDNLYLYGAGRYTAYLTGAAGFNIINSKIVGNSSYRAVYCGAGSSGAISFSEIEGEVGGIYQNTVGTINYNNVNVSGVKLTPVEIVAGTANFTNSLIRESNGRNAYSLVNTGGTVSLVNSYVGLGWGAMHRCLSGAIATDTDNIYGGDIGIKSHSFEGFLIPCVDDISNLEYAKSVETELASRVLKGTYAVETYAFSANAAELQAMVNRGVMEVGVHSYSHSKLDSTVAFSVLKAGQTIDISRSTDTITISGVDPLTPYKSLTLTAIRAWMELNGCTIGALGYVGTNSLGEILDDVAGQSIDSAFDLPLLLDPTGATGFYYVEIVMAKATAEAALTGYTANTFLSPWGASTADAEAIVLAAGYTSMRVSSSIAQATYDLRNIDLMTLGFIDAPEWTNADEGTAVKWAHSIARAITNGYVLCPLSHATVNATIAQWAALLDATDAYSSVTVTSCEDVAEIIRGSDDWSTTDDRVYTRSFVDAADYHLANTSPLIGVGADVGLTQDIEGNKLYAPFNIGAFGGTGEGLSRPAITTPGPLGLDATVVSGTTLSDAVIKAPLGPEFQEIAEWTNNASVDLATLAPTARTRIGPRGLLIYDEDLSAADQAKADKYLGAV